MDDSQIVALYFARDQRAVKESRSKYGRLCRSVAMRVLGNREDAEEAENDTYLRAWDSIPPAEPKHLGAYLAAVCRRLSIDRLRAGARQKRGAGQYISSLDELDHAVADLNDPADEAALKDALERFLGTLKPDARDLFLKRYWWFLSIRDIARQTGKSESAVKTALARTREQLRAYLEGDM